MARARVAQRRAAPRRVPNVSALRNPNGILYLRVIAYVLGSVPTAHKFGLFRRLSRSSP
jgi:hypothetical protein